ncbi:MAG: sulfite exporter TauE/SafE family protein [Acidiferrobacteraceae bacterium]
MHGLTTPEVLIGSAVVLAAFVIRGVSGFGSGIIAVPPLALMLPLHMVVPAVTLLNYIASLRLGVRDLKHIAWRELAPLAPSSLAGILIALYLFRIRSSALTLALGVFVIGFGLYTLLNTRVRRARSAWAVPAGLLGGLVDMLFSSGGPIYVMYLNARQLDKTVFRASISAFLIAESTLRLAGYATEGFYRRPELALILFSIPVMSAGVYIGEHIHTRISQRTFGRAIGILLIASGVLLLAR